MMRMPFSGVMRRCLFALALCGPLAVSASDVPYVPTPMNVVDAILELGGVGPVDFDHTVDV